MFTQFVEICDILGISEFTSLTGTETVSRDTIKNKLAMLDVPAVGVVGQLEEFQDEKSSSVVRNTHRHISHLVGLYPGRQLTPNATPALAAACEVSLDFRTDGGTAWWKAHKASARARLYDGQRAHSLLQNITRNHIFPSLLSSINKLDKLQIDCNFGYPAAVFEMLLQSHEEELHLLPALAPGWPSGSVSGIVGRGGFVVDMNWTEGTLYQASIHSRLGGPCTVRYGDSVVTLSIPQGSTVQLDGNLNLIDPAVEVAPSVGFSSPATDIIDKPVTDSSTLFVVANAYDLIGDETIALVTLYMGTVEVGTITEPPYEWAVNDLPEGSYTFTLVATDDTGRDSAVATRTVSMKEFEPTVSFSSPDKDVIGLPYNTTLSITADAHDLNGDETIAWVTLYKDGVEAGRDFSAPYEWVITNIDAASTSIFTLIATDDTGRDSAVASRTVNVAQLGDILLNPVADSYVRGRQYGNDNYGTLPTLLIKDHVDVYDRHAYLRFDLSTVPANINKATLCLKLASGTGSDIHTAYFVSDDSWGESTINWNTKPAGSTALDSASTPAVGQWIELDVTSQVASELAGDGTFSVVIIGAANTMITYHSKEADSESDRPQLVISRNVEDTTPTTYAEAALLIDWTGVPADKRGAMDNSDGDQYNNFLTWALGGSFTEPDTDLAPFEITDLGNGQMELRISYDKAVPTLNYELEWSTDLIDWSTIGVTTEQFQQETGLYSQHYVAPVGTDQIFWRLEVSE